MGLPVYDMPRAAVDLVLFQRRSVVESSGNFLGRGKIVEVAL